jgi:hypothetical protein
VPIVVVEPVTTGGGGGSGTVTSVTSADTSLTVTNPTTAASLKLATLDVIATNELAVAAVPLNAQKITGLANGSAATDAAAFGQIPAALPPNGAAGGDLSGTYPNPKVAKITETSGPTDLTIGTVTDGQFLKRSGTTIVSGAPVASVAATDASIVVAGTATAPTVATGTLDVIATQHPPAANWSNNSRKITSLLDPTGAQDAATKGYVDTQFSAVNPAVAVTIATTAASDTSALTYANGVGGIGATFTGAVNTAITIDGVTLTTLNQRVLVKNDTQAPSGAFNGVYYLTQLQTGILAPVLTRALDYDQTSDINSTGAIPVVSGTANGGSSWLLTSTVATVGTDPLTYTRFSYAATATANAVLTTTGDIVYASAANTLARLAIGAAGTRLGVAAGLPAWSLPPGYEFDYAQFTATVDITATTEGTANSVISGNAVTYDGATTVMIEFQTTGAQIDTAGVRMRVILLDGATVLGWLCNFGAFGTAGENLGPYRMARRLTPSAASHTYSVAAFLGSAGTGHLFGAGGGSGAFVPGFIRITKAA